MTNDLDHGDTVDDEAGTPTRAQFAYSAIRDMILAGRVPGGGKLVEAELGKQLDLSRTPVREALKRLEADGLIENTGGRGLTVATLSQDQIAELFELREAIEGMAARLAAQRAGYQDILNLRRLIEEQDSIPISDIQRVLSADDRFHRAVHVAAHNRYVLQASETWEAALAVMRITTLPMFAPSPEAREHHRSIFEAIETNDGSAAEEIARMHIRNSRRKRLDILEQLTGR